MANSLTSPFISVVSVQHLYANVKNRRIQACRRRFMLRQQRSDLGEHRFVAQAIVPQKIFARRAVKFGSSEKNLLYFLPAFFLHRRQLESLIFSFGGQATLVPGSNVA